MKEKKTAKNITQQKIEKYIGITEKAINGISVAEEKNIRWKDVAADFLDMAQRYLSDAKHYYEKGDFVTAFAAVNYAHGWLDAGARLGLFDIDEKCRELFTID